MLKFTLPSSLPPLPCSTEQVKKHLEDYFHKSQQACTQGGLDQNLCLLCIQCFEVSCMCRVCKSMWKFFNMLMFSLMLYHSSSRVFVCLAANFGWTVFFACSRMSLLLLLRVVIAPFLAGFTEQRVYPETFTRESC